MKNVIRQYTKKLISDKEKELQLFFFDNYKIEHAFCSCWDNPYPWYIPNRQVMDNFMIIPNSPIYVKANGQGKWIDRGEIFFVPQGDWHEYGLAEPHAESTEHLIMHTFIRSKKYVNILKLLPGCIHAVKNIDVWYKRFQEVVIWSEHDRNMEMKLGEAAIFDFIKELLAMYADEIQIPGNPIDSRILAACEIMRKEYSKDLIMEELGQKVGLRQVQFRKLFKEAMGSSPKSYLTMVRLEAVCGLLRKTDLTLSEISRKTGFNYENYLYAVFKKYTGFTPNQFRNSDSTDLPMVTT